MVHLKEDRVLPNTMRLYISCYPPQNRAVFRTLCFVTYIHKPVLHLSVLNHLLPTRVKKNSLPFPSAFPFFIFLFWFLSFWLPRFVFFFLPPQYWTCLLFIVTEFITITSLWDWYHCPSLRCANAFSKTALNAYYISCCFWYIAHTHSHSVGRVLCRAGRYLGFIGDKGHDVVEGFAALGLCCPRG